MVGVGNGLTEFSAPISSSSTDNFLNTQGIAEVLKQMKGVLSELDRLDLARAAAYLSMAIDQVETDFATNSD